MPKNDAEHLHKLAANWGVRQSTTARSHILKALHAVTNDPWFGLPEFPPSQAANAAMIRLVESLNDALAFAKKAESESRKSGWVTV